jgi:hypothetical protein
VAAKRHHIDEDKAQIKSEIVKMHLLQHFSDHICQLGKLLNASSELPEKAMMDVKEGYRQSNCHEAAFQSLRMQARMEVL